MERIVLVTGAARGIGNALCRLLLHHGNTVVACPRRSGSETLAELAKAHPGALHEVPMDVADRASVEAAAREIGNHVERVDVLFNNAGIYVRDRRALERLDTEMLVREFRVNSVGPLHVIAALLPLLRKGRDKRLVQVTSLMGSVGDNSSGGSYGYRMSKAALNMAVKNLAHELGPEGFIALAIHPGWVDTDMGGSQAPMKVGPAAAEVLRIALAASAEDNGAFLGPGGKPLPY